MNIKLNFEHFCAEDQGGKKTPKEANAIDKDEETRRIDTMKKVSVDGLVKKQIQEDQEANEDEAKSRTQKRAERRRRLKMRLKEPG